MWPYLLIFLIGFSWQANAGAFSDSFNSLELITISQLPAVFSLSSCNQFFDYHKLMWLGNDKADFFKPLNTAYFTLLWSKTSASLYPTQLAFNFRCHLLGEEAVMSAFDLLMAKLEKLDAASEEFLYLVDDSIDSKYSGAANTLAQVYEELNSTKAAGSSGHELPKKFAAVKATLNEFNKGNLNFISLINAFAGNSSLLSSGISLSSFLEKIVSEFNDENKKLKAGHSAKQSALSNNIDVIETQGFELIPENLQLNNGAIFAGTPYSFKSLADKLQYELAKAKNLGDEASKLESLKPKGWLSNAVALRRNASIVLDNSVKVSNGMIEKAGFIRGVLLTKLHDLQQSISKLISTLPPERSLVAKAKLAFLLMEDDRGTLGEEVRRLSNQIEKIKALGTAIESGSFGQLVDIRVELNKAKHMVYLAEKDGLDVYLQKKQLDELTQQLNLISFESNNVEAELAFIFGEIWRVNNFIEGESSKFFQAEILPKRSLLKRASNLNLLSSTEELEFEKLYFFSTLPTNEQVGRLKENAVAASKMFSRLENRIPKVLKEQLQYASVVTETAAPTFLGEDSEVNAFIEISNEFKELNLEVGHIALDFEFPPDAVVVSKSAGLAFSRGKVIVTSTSLDNYRAQLQYRKKLISQIKVEEHASALNHGAVYRKKISFTSLMPIQVLIPYFGEEIVTSVPYEIGTSNLILSTNSGQNALLLSKSQQNPFEVKREETIENNSIIVRLVVTNAVFDLDSARLEFIENLNCKPEGFEITYSDFGHGFSKSSELAILQLKSEKWEKGVARQISYSYYCNSLQTFVENKISSMPESRNSTFQLGIELARQHLSKGDITKALAELKAVEESMQKLELSQQKRSAEYDAISKSIENMGESLKNYGSLAAKFGRTGDFSIISEFNSKLDYLKQGLTIGKLSQKEVKEVELEVDGFFSSVSKAELRRSKELCEYVSCDSITQQRIRELEYLASLSEAPIQSISELFQVSYELGAVKEELASLFLKKKQALSGLGELKHRLEELSGNAKLALNDLKKSTTVATNIGHLNKIIADLDAKGNLFEKDDEKRTRKVTLEEITKSFSEFSIYEHKIRGELDSLKAKAFNELSKAAEKKVSSDDYNLGLGEAKKAFQESRFMTAFTIASKLNQDAQKLGSDSNSFWILVLLSLISAAAITAIFVNLRKNKDDQS